MKTKTYLLHHPVLGDISILFDTRFHDETAEGHHLRLNDEWGEAAKYTVPRAVTFCAITTIIGGIAVIGEGIATCSGSELFSLSKGQNISLHRAIQDHHDNYAPNWGPFDKATRTWVWDEFRKVRDAERKSKGGEMPPKWILELADSIYLLHLYQGGRRPVAEMIAAAIRKHGPRPRAGRGPGLHITIK